MSQYGDGDYCPVWEETSPKARRPHKCHACGETIPVGTVYSRTFYVFDGDAHTTKRCPRCQLIYEHLSARIRSEGDVEEFCDAELKCGHEYTERWREEPSAALAALAFWRPGDPLPSPEDLSPGRDEATERKGEPR